MFSKNEIFVLFVIAGIFLMSSVSATPPVQECYGEGESIPVIAEPLECCEGLNLITPKEADIVGISGICTAECGNGVCNSLTESAYNCSVDCEKCTPEGESSSPPYNCCPGLDLVSDCLPDEACPISLRYCIDCGNGICGAHENWYNCPEDCGEQECAENGEKVYYRTEFGPTYCCSRNAGIKLSSFLDPESGQCIAMPDGSKGTCVDNWWRTCGDGKCNEGEDKCNCLADCASAGCAAKITIDFDKTEYQSGDSVSTKITIFDSEGRPMPNTSFKVEGWANGESLGTSTLSTGPEGVYAPISEVGSGMKEGKYRYRVSTIQDNCTTLSDEATIYINAPSCACPLVYSPVCGVDGRTYSNKCIAGCENVEVAYDGACRPNNSIKVEIGEKFELNEKQSALLLENGVSTGIEIKLLHLPIPCKVNEPCLTIEEANLMPSVQLEVSKRYDNSATGVMVYLWEGQTEEVFGIKITNLKIGSSQAVLLTKKESVPDYIKVKLDEEFSLADGQTAHVMKANRELMKVNFDGVVQSGSCGEGSGSSTNESEPVKCRVDTYAQMRVSLASGGVHYFSLRAGQTKEVGNYTIYLHSLGKDKRYSAVLVVKEKDTQETVIAYLGRPFSLQEKQKAIVKETNLQLRLLELGNDVALVEVWAPATVASSSPGGGGSGVVARTAASNSVMGSESVSSSERAQIVEAVESKIATGNTIHRPYIKLRAGETQEIYGHEITLNGIAMPNCGVGVNCVGASGIANFTIAQEPLPNIKTVYLNEKFGLEQQQTAIVMDSTRNSTTRYEAMRIKLLGIAVPTVMCAEDSICDVRPVADISIESELFNGRLTMRGGQEESVGGYTVRLLDISNTGKAVFIVRKGVSEVIKVRLDEKFNLSESQTALVVEEGLYVKLEGIQMVTCAGEDTKCIGGSYATVSVWKNYANSTIGLHKVKEGDTLKLYGLRITLLDLASREATFVVRKGVSNLINVHINEHFKLEERQAARVLEANMRVDLLGIVRPTCGIDVECKGGEIVEISVSNYLFSKEMTGKSLAANDYLETVVEEEATSEASGTVSSGIGAPVPPTPFDIYRLGVGESVTVNDFVITVLSIGYNSAEFVVKKKGSNVEMKLTIDNGWNLFSLPGDLDIISSSECDSSDLKLFEYIPGENTFVAAENPVAGKAYWLYNPGKTCSVKAIVREAIPMSEIDSLVVGWNFVPVTVDMIGSKMRDIGSHCDLKAAYFYNASSLKWQDAMDRTISASDLGKAFAVYARNACSLGAASTEPGIPMPTLPDLPNVEG